MLNAAQIFIEVDRQVEVEIVQLVSQWGVVPNPDAAFSLAEKLFLSVQELRRRAFSRHMELVLAENPGLTLPPVPEYTLQNLYKMIWSQAGLDPNRPNPARVSMFDPHTQQLAKVPLAPWTAPENPEMVSVFTRRLVASTQMHVRQAGREAVRNLAVHHSARYARQLSGSENCAFCALLASRGAVYLTKESAGEMNRYHPHCDCVPVLVQGETWSGKEHSDELRALWQESEDEREFGQKYRKLVQTQNNF